MAAPAVVSKLLVELDARTTGFDKGLADAQGKLRAFGTFVKAHPVAAAGAMGAALLGVAAQALKMAAEVDSAMRQIAASLPTGRQGIAQLREDMASLAVASG